ncbi:Kae1-associated serine/threonine protein kinase [Candidatus Woesearchaeota archaeon]|nr:Kae1-associated serine/threonine protein kinase [Candidatus Woesearchaeota archaeon]
MKQIGSGAEAIIYLDRDVIKDRIRKSYRIPEIDMPLRKTRTRREANILVKLNKISFPAPKLVYSDDKEKLKMDFIEGDKLRDALNRENCRKLCSELGEKVGILHNNNIIHGDLTTSNMLLNKKDSNKIYFIDFGLSFISHKTEDMAVDLHLLRQALESKHHEIWKECFDSAVEGYKKEMKDSYTVLKRLELVEKRGRYKGKAE